MARFCSICGRRLVKTQGSVGPVCEKKSKPKRWSRMPKDKYLAMLQKWDLFAGEDDGQKKNATTGSVAKKQTKGKQGSGKTTSEGRSDEA